MSLREPFWKLETRSEMEVVSLVLRRRFPETFSILEESLEFADPLDVVYPGNPGEYDDVVREIIVELPHVNGDLSGLSLEQVSQIVVEGLERCFGELPDRSRVRLAVDMIVEKSRQH
jgi:hypothetical protein